ncbi:MAG: hypothetical protein JSU00_28050 [Acidobacteria bacterium]|nr:hypothetical protein [Acidobacteriota bacterium]
MPEYRVFRLKDQLRQQFRWAPHLSGVTAVKPKDYDEWFTIAADSPYAAWHSLRGTDRELGLGDLLCIDGGDVRILKYIGFETAQWVLPEPKHAHVPPAEAAPVQPAATL